MLTEKDIRPVPKYILKKIEQEDAHRFPVPEKQVRFYAYLAIWKKELVKVTVAVRHAQRAPPFAKGPQSPCTGKDIMRKIMFLTIKTCIFLINSYNRASEPDLKSGLLTENQVILSIRILNTY